MEPSQPSSHRNMCDPLESLQVAVALGGSHRRPARSLHATIIPFCDAARWTRWLLDRDREFESGVYSLRSTPLSFRSARVGRGLRRMSSSETRNPVQQQRICSETHCSSRRTKDLMRSITAAFSPCAPAITSIVGTTLPQDGISVASLAVSVRAVTITLQLPKTGQRPRRRADGALGH